MTNRIYPGLVALVVTACGGTGDAVPVTPSVAIASAPVTAPAPSAIAEATASAAVTPPPAPAATTRTVALPGGTKDGVSMDFLLYEPATATIWAPAGNTGAVDVIDTSTGKLTSITGFATQEVPGREGKKRTVGPSSVTVGDGVVYIGNRGDASICAVDPKTLTRTKCGPKLDSMPDGIVYVPSLHEVWVTTPKDKSIRLLDAKTLKQKSKLTFEGNPEGYAVDATRGRFYTSLEDKDVTLAIDLKTHKTVATWKSSCGEDGPHGARLSESDGFLFIGCSAKVETLDVAHDGAIVSSVDTGDGVDDIDFVASTRSIYAGAGKAAQLVVIHADEHGKLSITSTTPTAPGARNAAVDAKGNAYLSHAKGSELIVVSPAGSP